MCGKVTLVILHGMGGMISSDCEHGTPRTLLNRQNVCPASEFFGLKVEDVGVREKVVGAGVVHSVWCIFQRFAREIILSPGRCGDERDVSLDLWGSRLCQVKTRADQAEGRSVEGGPAIGAEMTCAGPCHVHLLSRLPFRAHSI